MKLCWLYQWYMGWQWDASRSLPAWVDKHLAACPACQRAVQSHAELTHQLVTAARRLKVESPPFLQARIRAALDRADQAPTACGAWRLNWAAPMVSVGLALVFFLVLLSPPAPPQVGRPTAEPSSGLAKALAPLAPELQRVNRANLLAWSQNVEQPLEQEIQRVLSDAKSAVQVLAANFLPTAP